MQEVHLGDRVVHPDHGTGLVLKLFPGGRARVRFDGSHPLPRTVDVCHLQCEDVEMEEKIPPPAEVMQPPIIQRPRQPIDRDTAIVRQALEALRLGVVPSSHVEDYTVGRSDEVRSVESLLEDCRGLRLVWGDYGTGKTHILDLAEQAGIRAGFVTARVVLNPREVPPAHPMRLYRAFLMNLKYPDETGTGWRPLLNRLEGSKDHAEPGGKAYSRFFSPVLYALRSGDQDAIDWVSDYIEGYRMDSCEVTRAVRSVGWRGEGLLALSDYRTYGRMYVHMMGTLACWARDAGYRGLLLLMDEVEYVDSLHWGLRALASQVLMHYAAVTLPRKLLAFEEEHLYRGGHAVHRAINLSFREGQPLAVVMALTPLNEMVLLARNILRDDTVFVGLKPLGREDFMALIQKVIALYRRGFPDFKPAWRSRRELNARILDELTFGETSPREAVRTVVSVMDCLRYGRDPFDEYDPFHE